MIIVTLPSYNLIFYDRDYIDYLVDNGAPIESFHLMGHSAGAHIVGVAGAAVTSGRILRITGKTSIPMFKSQYSVYKFMLYF